MKYYFKPDWFVIIISIVVFATLAMTISIIPWTSIGSILIFLIITLSLIYGLAVMPIWIKITDKTIRVQQLLGHKTFKKTDITITRLDKSKLRGSIRVFGSGGYGGYTGWFRNKTLGKYFMLILNKKELALIQMKDGAKQYVINYPKELL